MKAIVEARGDKPFRDLSDFASRVNPRAINKRVLESLAAAGAFDALENNRARVYAGVDTILAAAQRRHEDAEIGQNDLFGGAATRETAAAAGGRGVAAGRAAAARVRRDRLLPLRPSARRLCGDP